MPHKKSAKKRLRQTIKLRAHNRDVKKALKKHLKVVVEGVQDKQTTTDQVKKDAVAAVKKFDKAAARGVLHRNTVARRKSLIARMINAKAKAPAPSAEPPKK